MHFLQILLQVIQSNLQGRNVGISTSIACIRSSHILLTEAVQFFNTSLKFNLSVLQSLERNAVFTGLKVLERLFCLISIEGLEFAKFGSRDWIQAGNGYVDGKITLQVCEGKVQRRAWLLHCDEEVGTDFFLESNDDFHS